MDAFSSSASGNPAPSSLKGSEPGARATGGDRSETLATVRRLYDAGLYLQALDASEPLGHLRHWAGIDERLLAARLALQLGAPRLSLRHRLRAWREAADHPEVAYYRAALVSEYEGPYACWWFLGSHGDLPDAAPDIRASWFCLHAFCLGTLRDFDRAETWLDRAAAADPGNPWIATSRATLFLQQDRLEEAIAADDEALGLHPWFRPAVQSRFSLLALANRDAEAFDFRLLSRICG